MGTVSHHTRMVIPTPRHVARAAENISFSVRAVCAYKLAPALTGTRRKESLATTWQHDAGIAPQYKTSSSTGRSSPRLIRKHWGLTEGTSHRVNFRLNQLILLRPVPRMGIPFADNNLYMCGSGDDPGAASWALRKSGGARNLKEGAPAVLRTTNGRNARCHHRRCGQTV